MFRITFVDGPPGVTVRIEGRFVGHFAQEATQVIVSRDLPADFVVDLTDITFADSAGEEALSSLIRIGAKFVAENSYSLHLCERLHLPIATGPAHSPTPNSGPTATLLPMFTPADG